jgi:arylsulfatase A-like enzyme/tetratricopeptide (TPR) repeat protein
MCLAFTLALLGTLASGCIPAASVDRVVLVTIDTLRADHLGCYGGRWVDTPVLDALAERGVRFETAISPAPLTLPAHASLMTGLDPPRHGVRNNATFELAGDLPTLAQRMREQSFATAAFIGAVVLDRQYGLARGFEHYDDRMAPRHAAGELGFAERTADRVIDSATAWLKRAPDRFFLWLHLYDPHADYKPPARYLAESPSHPYAGEIAFADAQLGRLVDLVGTRWDEGRTLFVITSDHGESLGEHGEMTHSFTIYDATQRVPLILSGAGLSQGKVEQATARLVDVAPTILALARAEPFRDSDGRDLLANSPDSHSWQSVAYLETLVPQLDLGWSPLLGARSARFKYIRAPRPELYDLREDPGETRNLFRTRPEVVEELEQVLEGRLANARPVEPTLMPDAARREQLVQLGYLAADAAVATGELGQVGGIDPKDAMAQIVTLQMALSLMTAGRPEDALAMLEPLDGEGYMFDFYRSEAARQAGRADAAERFARASLAKAPAVSAVHLVLGNALEAQGRLEEATRSFEEAARLDSASAEPVVGLGRIAEARGELDRAVVLYERATDSRGASAEALWRHAALRIEGGERADDLLSRIPTEAKNRPRAALRLARAEAKAGRRGRALARLERALRSSPGSADLVFAIYEQQGRADVAIEQLKASESAGLLGSHHRVQLARLHLGIGNSDRARELYEVALAENPELAGAKNDLAFLLAREGRDLDRALQLAQEAQQALGEEPEVIDTLGYVMLRRGLAGPAAEQFASAIRLTEERGGASADLHYHMGLAMRALGREGPAAEHLAKALSTDPEFADAQDARRQLEATRAAGAAERR